MIPRRPWRIVEHDPSIFRGTFGAVVDADDCAVFQIGRGVVHPDMETARVIVALVNAQPEIIASLEAADVALRASPASNRDQRINALAAIHAALGKLRP